MIKIQCEEKDIEDFLCSDMRNLLSLRLVKRQVETPAGIIDILAYDTVTQVYFVIELKKNRLNADSLAQVLRYSNYLNCNKSKGKRVFVPLLIGMSLDEQLYRSVFFYEPNDIEKRDFGKVYYTLFNYCHKSGITFNWHNKAQYEYEVKNLRADHSGYIESLINAKEDMDFEVYQLSRMLSEGK